MVVFFCRRLEDTDEDIRAQAVISVVKMNYYILAHKHHLDHMSAILCNY